MRVVALSGGIGGARFLTGLLSVLTDTDPVTVIANTADDMWLLGLRVCPDLDTVMYTLSGASDAERGWGRADESWKVLDELRSYAVEPSWFGLGDRDLATHLARTQLLRDGHPLSAATEILCRRWRPRVDLLPMTDDEVETHVVIDDATAGRRTVHFQEYWVRLGAPRAYAVVATGAGTAKPAPGVLEAIAAADLLVFPPSNPVVSIGTILAVPGVREAIADAPAPVVGVSPIIGGHPVRGMADQLLRAIGVDVSAAAVAQHYGARTAGGLLDGWLVDTADHDAVHDLTALGIDTRAVPLLMSDPERTAQLAAAVLRTAEEIVPRR
ncbi:MAG: 2-phospho-L-lactate transferase [Sciscionella sp.]